MNLWIEGISSLFLAYYACANLIFFLLLILSFVSIRRRIDARPMIESLRARSDLIAPSVSIIAPAYNEQETILQSIHSFLKIDYPHFEVLVVNDGSTDSTSKKIKEEFDMEPALRFYDDRLSTIKVHQFFRSKTHTNLFLIDKSNGGKADAINVGIGYCENELFCAVDSDSILDNDSLLRVVVPFIEDPINTIASGGTVRPVNGCEVSDGRVKKLRFPKRPLELVQIIEYLRAFLFGRLGWNVLDSTMIISGAFGVFKRTAVANAGGYLRGSVGEDMELVLRLRKNAVQRNEEHRIAFVPDPICWTEVPSTLRGLAQQRDRWQRGLAESLWENKQMLFNPRYGAAGLIGYPYFLFVELFGPIVEVAAYIFIVVGLSIGFISRDFFILFLTVDIVFGLFMSATAIFIEESAFHKYPTLRQLLVLLGLSALEQLGYRQLNTALRLRGLIRYLQGERTWGQNRRLGFQKEESSSQL